ncbi:MAG: HAD family hydrolase, partial [Muribaculaceae bacterium]|nr:HAD family hydrolase [Muribaculaceae bacterium]
DSETEYTRIWNQIDSEFPTGVENFAGKIKGTNLDDILTRHYPDPEVRSNVIQRLYEEEGKMKYTYSEGAQDVLKRLKEAGVPVALYTSSNHKKMEHLYRDIPEIKEYFDYMVLGDMVEESKPSPEGYLKAAAGLGLESGDWIVVEDSLQGVIAGERSGGEVVGVAGTLEESVLAPHCDVVIHSMREFPYEMLGI